MDVLKLLWIKYRLLINRKRNAKSYMFLDFDGVLNVAIEEGTEEYDRAIASGNYADRQIVQRISNLCLKYNMSVIITSSWRYEGIEFCRKYLRDAGLSEQVEIADITRLDSFERENDIFTYLKEHDCFRCILILDDIKMTYLKGFAVNTYWETGLTEELSILAEKIVKKELG